MRRCLLALGLLICFAAATVAPSRVNEWATETSLPDAGRGSLASQTLDYGEIVACFFETLDTKSDQELTVGEIQRGLRAHMSWTEQFHSGLSVETLVAKCDANADGVITYAEMEGANGRHCLDTNQQESIARYLCSRKKHKDLAASSYRATYDVWRQAFHDGSMLDTFRSESNKLNPIFQPHAGRLVGSRVIFPGQDEQNRIGQGLDPQLIIFLAALYLIVVLLILFVVYVLPAIVDLVIALFF
jgi:hypothetical protein